MNNQNKIFFETDRLKVLNWRQYKANSIELANAIAPVVTTNVMKTLPPSWQQLDSAQSRLAWIKEREAESFCLAICNKKNNQLIGILLLSLDNADARVGYFIAECFWGQGFASEVVSGLCQYINDTAIAKTITGGVAPENISSVKVLLNNGFKKDTTESTIDTHFYKFTANIL